MSLNAARIQTPAPAGCWWWHPHFADVASSAVAAEANGCWWWHPHATSDVDIDI